MRRVFCTCRFAAHDEVKQSSLFFSAFAVMLNRCCHRVLMSTLICLHSQIANTRISHHAKLAQPAREAEGLSLRVSWSCWYCKGLTITFTAFRETDTKIIQDLTCVSHSMSSRVLFICVLVCRHPGDIDAEPFRFAYLVIYDLPGCGFYQFDTRVVRKRLHQWRQKDSQS